MSTHGLPAFRVIETTLRRTTERLVREIVEPRTDAPVWNEFEWSVARAVCALQGIAGLLARRLQWHGTTPWEEFLATQRGHLLARDERIDRTLARLDECFRDGGVAFVPLKGSSLRALRIHSPGDRPQSDIDLLIDPADRAASIAQLERVGYELEYSDRRHDVFIPHERAEPCSFGEHRATAIRIELHSRFSESLPIETVDITATIFPARRVPGANPYASLAALLRNLCLHAAGAMRAQAMRFIQIYDIALLARRLAESDWRELTDSRDPATDAWWLFPPLALAERYVPGSVPAPVLATLRAVCPRLLRERYARATVYDVSWSNLRIAALPGHEWARTLGDKFRFARSRVLPSRDALDELASRTAQPSFSRVRWYRASHPERILRWLISRPPRVQTMSAILASRELGPAA